MLSLRRHIHGLFSSIYQPLCHASLSWTRSYLPPSLRSILRPEGKLRYEAEEKFLTEPSLVNLAEKFKKFSVSPWFRNMNSFYDATFRRLIIGKRLDLVEDLLEDQKRYWNISEEPFTCRILLLYGNAGMVDHALKLFDQMPRLNCPRTSRTLNTLLAVCLDAKRYDKLFEVFRDVPKRISVKPGMRAYNCLLKAHCDMGEMDSAVTTVDDMEWNGIDPSVSTYHILLDGFYRKDMIPEAESVWKTLERKGMKPSLRCYTSKIHCLARHKKTMEAMEVLKVMKDNGIKPDSFTFSHLLNGYCGERKYEEAKSLYTELEKLNICHRDKVFHNLIPLALEKNDLEFSLRLTGAATTNWCHLEKSIIKGLVDLLVKEGRGLTLHKLKKFLKRRDGYYEYEPEWFLTKNEPEGEFEG